MNLGRAKTIFIVAFIGLNLFLGYQLFWPDFGRLTRVAVTPEELRALDNLLNENNYYLEVPIARAIQTGDFLSVRSARNVQLQVIEPFARSGARVVEFERVTFYRMSGAIAVIHDGGLIQVFFEPAVKLGVESVNPDERELSRLAEHFLQERNLLPENASFNYAEKTDDGYLILHYHQMIDALPLYSGQLRVVLESGQVSVVEINWLEPVKSMPAREITVISAADALTNLVRALGPSPEPVVIRQIDLGYFSGEYDAEKWEIPPVWRVVLEENNLYYINAFTGNLEHDSLT